MEVWKDTTEFPDTHEVSSTGRVKSKARKISRGRGFTWQGEIILKFEESSGYHRVVISPGNGKRVQRSVHRLVALAFLSPVVGANQVMHLDGARQNNRASNLAWGTGAQNQRMRIEHGTSNRGENHAMSVLTEDAVREIIERRKGKENLQTIADDFGVTRSLICAVVNGRAWAHLERDYSNPAEFGRRLSDDQVRAIRQRRADGEKIVPLGREFGVTHGMISAIFYRKCYVSVPDVKN